MRIPQIKTNAWRAWDVWRKRFKFGAPSPSLEYGFLPVIVGQVSADEAMEDVDIEQKTVSVTGTGWVAASNTVAAGVLGNPPDVWKARAIYVEKSGGTWTFTKIALYDSDGHRLEFDCGGSVTEYLWEFPQVHKLRVGWRYEVYVDAHTVTGNLVGRLYHGTLADRDT